jgi:hypothetical protein
MFRKIDKPDFIVKIFGIIDLKQEKKMYPQQQNYGGSPDYWKSQGADKKVAAGILGILLAAGSAFTSFIWVTRRKA